MSRTPQSQNGAFPHQRTAVRIPAPFSGADTVRSLHSQSNGGFSMKVSYEFADGTTFEVEVSDELGPMIISSRTAEESSDRKERRHCWSLDAILYEGTEYGKGHRPGWQHAPKRPAARQQPGLPGVKGRGEHARDRRGQQHDKGREEAQHAGRVHRAGAILMGSGRPVAVQRIRTGLIRQGAQRRD